MINRPSGPDGDQGIGYDYVLAADGLWIQAGSPRLTARVRIADATVRGLARCDPKLTLAGGLIPVELFERGLLWTRQSPESERMFVITADEDQYRLEFPTQLATATSVAYKPNAVAVAEFHTHASSRAFFSATDDADEQGFRIYGVIGRLDQKRPELNLRVGIYGHFGGAPFADIFRGDVPNIEIIEYETLDKKRIAECTT